ncbi:hypothetical protein WJ968_30225 [Achromobacter xylosoxidans]
MTTDNISGVDVGGNPYGTGGYEHPGRRRILAAALVALTGPDRAYTWHGKPICPRTRWPRARRRERRARTARTTPFRLADGEELRGAAMGLPWAKTPVLSLEPVAVRAAGLRMAQRTLARLVRAHQVLRAPAPGGHVIYALAEAGVRRLVEIGAPALTGKDLIRRFSAAQFRTGTRLTS